MTDEKEIQTDLSGYEMQVLYEQYVECDDRLDVYKQEIADLNEMVKHYEQVEREQYEEIEEQAKKEFELRRLAAAPVFHTVHSSEYHRRRNCRFLHRTIERLTACRECTEATLPDVKFTQ